MGAERRFRKWCNAFIMLEQWLNTMSVTKQTALFSLHQELGGKMVPFAGYDMPVQYPLGIMKEHLHTRASAGLFDVSHMGQVELSGDNVEEKLETLLPADVQALKPGRIKYSFFTNDDGGVIDDLMITKDDEGKLFLVINAGCKEGDLEHMRKHLKGVEIVEREDQGLIALQGPQASAVLSRFAPEAETQGFMSCIFADIDGVNCRVSRSGYSGEDGYEISIPNSDIDRISRLLLAEAEVEAIGLGARDSLRLESGLCLYGHELDTSTTPVEADIIWAIPKSRRSTGGFPGAERILSEITEGPKRIRVGIKPEGRAPMREGTALFSGDEQVGTITSGGFGPSAGHPVAMAIIRVDLKEIGTELEAEVRGKRLACKVADLPFVKQNYYRKPK